MMGNQLDRYRKKINRIDRKVIRLLRRRYAYVRSIGFFKKQAGLPVADQEREAAVLNKVEEAVREREARGYIQSVFRSIFKASYRVERK